MRRVLALLCVAVALCTVHSQQVPLTPTPSPGGQSQLAKPGQGQQQQQQPPQGQPAPSIKPAGTAPGQQQQQQQQSQTGPKAPVVPDGQSHGALGLSGASWKGKVWDTSRCASLPATAPKLLKTHCANANAKHLDALCTPVLQQPQGQLKGLVVLVHGYSACSQQYKALIPQLTAKGLRVWVPNMPGHGKAYVPSCQLNGQKLDKCQDGYDISELPTNEEPYVTFAKQINEAVREHVTPLKQANPNFIVGIGGLSVGGAVAITAAAEGNGLYTHMHLWAPFLGITSPGMDRDWRNIFHADPKCATNSASCVAKFVGKLAGVDGQSLVAELAAAGVTGYANVQKGQAAYHGLQAVVRSALHLAGHSEQFLTSLGLQPLEFLNGRVSWGEGCEKDRTSKTLPRGGYCAFHARNLLGAHAIGQHARSVAGKINKAHTMTVAVERDGCQRNGLIYKGALAKFASKNGNSDSSQMFRIEHGCDLAADGNKCGMPHSAMSREDNQHAPTGMWWEAQMHQGAVAFFSTPQPAPLKAAPPQAKYQQWTDKAKPQAIALPNFRESDPQEYMIADVVEVDGQAVATKLAQGVAKEAIKKLLLAMVKGTQEGPSEAAGVHNTTRPN